MLVSVVLSCLSTATIATRLMSHGVYRLRRSSASTRPSPLSIDTLMRWTHHELGTRSISPPHSLFSFPSASCLNLHSKQEQLRCRSDEEARKRRQPGVDFWSVSHSRALVVAAGLHDGFVPGEGRRRASYGRGEAGRRAVVRGAGQALRRAQGELSVRMGVGFVWAESGRESVSVRTEYCRKSTNFFHVDPPSSQPVSIELNVFAYMVYA